MSYRRTSLVVFFLHLGFLVSIPAESLQAQSHPHLYFDRAGMDALRDRVNNNPRLNKIWREFVKDRLGRAMKLQVPDGPIDDLELGRNLGDGIGDLTMAYVVTRDNKYRDKAKELALGVAAKSSWGEQLSIAHISIGMAFCWDVLYDEFSSEERKRIRAGVRANANNHVNPNQLANHNWTPSAGEGLIGLAFRGDGNGSFNKFAEELLNSAKQNFKESDRSVLWAHGSDGFSPQGLGYWRKYNHMALFLYALRFNEPENDWFHLGKEYPGSAFLKNQAKVRIYADVLHPDLSCLTWNDSHQVSPERQGHYGTLGMITLAASEYQDGYALSFLDYLLNETDVRFEDEDVGTFIFYDDTGVPNQSFRDLPLSGYWPNMEGAIFRSGWNKEDIIFYMRCGSPGGHVRRIKGLRQDKHSHPDANGFVLFYNHDYLAAEDGGKPQFGPDYKKHITYGHNTILIDGKGQKGDKSLTANTTRANMDFLDAPHVGYLLGDASDAYRDLQRFYRFVIYKKHKYFIIVDELEDDVSHKYEFLLGTDPRHTIRATGDGTFRVEPTDGQAKLPVIFVEPTRLSSSIATDRPYRMQPVYVDLLRVWPARKDRKATFFALLYPRKKNQSDPTYSKIYDGSRSGIVVDGNEYHVYNPAGDYTFREVTTDARLFYFKDDPNAFEYLAAGATEFLYQGTTQGVRSTKPLVAAFEGSSGVLRLGKNLGEPGAATITLYYPGITGVTVDGVEAALVDQGPGFVSFRLSPKLYQDGPTGYEQTVTDNYRIEILTGAPAPFVQLTAPNGGEDWPVNSTQTVRWNSDGSFANVRLEYSTDGGQSWTEIAASTANDGTFDWSVPDAPTTQALVRVSDAADGSPADASDAVFTISASPPTPAPPVVSGFSPTSGPVGTSVTLSGENFTNATDVQFNGVAADFAVLSDAELVATVPVGATTGPLRVTNPAGSGTSATDFVVTDESGGTLTFQPVADAYVWSARAGRNYGSRATLHIRNREASVRRAYLKFEVTGTAGDVQRATLRLYVNRAADDAGAVYLVDNNYSGSSTPWTEDGLTWRNAPQLPNTPLDAPGTVEENTWVEFDVTAAVPGDGVVSFAISKTSPRMIKYEARENSNAPELVVVTTAAPTEPPVITSFTPTSGEVGTRVTIDGQFLSGTTRVTFAGTDAQFRVESDSRLLATVPEGATTGKIRVTTPAGSAASQQDFEVLPPSTPPPEITGFAPTSGPVGTEVTLSGSGFADVTQVRFNGTAAGFTVSSDREIVATVPEGATTGPIAVTSPAGSATSADDFVVTGTPPGAQTHTLFPTDDAFVWSKKPNDNYFDNAALRVRKTSKTQIAFFKFDLSGVSGTVSRATLRLRCVDGGPDGGEVFLVSNDWDETTLTWNNAPALTGAALDAAGAVTAGQTVTFDVTAAVTGAGVVSFAVKNASRDVVMYSSKEGVQVPELVVGTAAALAKRNPTQTSEDAPSGAAAPERFELQAAFPNPFNLETTVRYALPKAGRVRLVVYNLLGRRVRTLVDGDESAGLKTVRWDGLDAYGREVSSGVYLIRLQAGGQVLTRRVVLQK